MSIVPNLIRSLFFAFALAFLFSCNPLENEVEIEIENDVEQNQEDELPEFIYADISKQNKGFDELLYKDEEHLAFISRYSDGTVESYLTISEQDTLFMSFSQNGFPEYMTNNQHHVVFCSFQKNVVHVAVIDPEGEYEIVDWETDTDWKEYGNTLVQSKVATIKRERELAQSSLLYYFGEKLAKVPKVSYKGSLIKWFPFAIGYISDEPIVWNVLDMGSIVADGTSASKILWHFGKMIPNTMAGSISLFTIDALVVVYDIRQICEGIRKGKFGNPLWSNKDYSIINRMLEAFVWLDESSTKCKWPGTTGRVSLNVDVSMNYESGFDVSTIQLGLVSQVPDWVDIDIVSDGEDSYFTYTVHENKGYDTRSCIIKFWAGSEVGYTKSFQMDFEITQACGVVFNPQEVLFLQDKPQSVTVSSPSEEYWEIKTHPDWLDIDIEGDESDIDRVLYLHPNNFDKAFTGVIRLSVFSVAGFWYDVNIPVYVIKTYSSCPDLNHPHAINLGLDVKWACCNLGASSPTDYGGYYAWGETEEKEYYSIGNYKWAYYWVEPGFGTYHYSKYNLDEVSGNVDNKKELDSADDVARQKMGDCWRMPTKEELSELLQQCTVNVIDGSVSGKYFRGALLTGPNGNSVFFPYAGYVGSRSDGWEETRELYDEYHYGMCWTSSLNDEELYHEYRSSCAYCYHNNYLQYTTRDTGLNVRAVYE